jgi:type II secretory pathway predicted ATPase ExeA
MYEQHWQLKEKPFENTPDPRFLYHSPQHEEGLNRLLYVVKERKGAGLLTGVYGCGKTLLARSLMKELENSVYKVAIVLVFVVLSALLSTISVDDLSLVLPRGLLKRPAVEKGLLPDGN